MIRFTLLENGKDKFIVKMNAPELKSPWTISNATSGEEMGTIKYRTKYATTQIKAYGTFGNVRIEGMFREHEYTIKKDGQLIARIHKKDNSTKNVYDLKIYESDHRALVVLFTIVVDEMRPRLN